MNINTKKGIQFGIVAFIFYGLMTYFKYLFFSQNLFVFSLSSAIIFFLFIGIWIWAVQHILNDKASSSEIKDIFRTVFIVIILGEFGFTIINYLYPFYIENNFFNHFHDRNKVWMQQNSSWPPEKQAATLQSILDQKNVIWKQILQGFGQSLIIDSIIAIVVVLISKRVRQGGSNTTFQNYNTIQNKN